MKLFLMFFALIFTCCGCQAEEVADAPVATITDAITFAEACIAADETCVFGEMPTAIVLDGEAFGKVITEGSGVVFIADPSDLTCRVLAPVLFEQMAANNSVLQLYLPDDEADCEGLMQRVIDGGISITGSKPHAEQLAETGGIPCGAVLYLKDGKIVAMHMGSLKDRTDEAAALTDDEVAFITDMLQFQLDKLLSGSCETGC